MTPIDETIKFVWIDENGEQCSPTHEKIRSALNWAVAWDERWDRATERWGQWEDMPRHIRDPLTRTGKKPVRMEQRVVRTYAEPLTEAQQLLVDTFTDNVT